MSYYAVVDDFRAGMPQTALTFRPRGIACHTTEGAEGEAGALGTIKFLIDRADRNASYHEIWYPKNGGFEARRIVRFDRAAHSMNPAQPPWNPNARVRRILGDKWGDPNAYAYAVSIAGTTATTVPRLVTDPGFMSGARRRYAELLAQFPTLVPDPMFNHGEGQADRSDWGPLMRPAILQPEDDVSLANMSPLFGSTASLAAGATARRTPAFDRTDYDAGKLFSLASPSSAPALGWVQGTNLTLADGTVFDARTRWLATWNKDHGIVFWHERDVTAIKPPAETDAAAKLKVAEDTIAALMTKIAAATAALK